MQGLTRITIFGLGNLALEQRRALTLVYGSSVALLMGVNYIQPAFPALMHSCTKRRSGEPLHIHECHTRYRKYRFLGVAANDDACPVHIGLHRDGAV